MYGFKKMDQQAFDLLMDRIGRMEEKIDELLVFKWKIYGASGVIGFVGALAMHLILKVI